MVPAVRQLFSGGLNGGIDGLRAHVELEQQLIVAKKGTSRVDSDKVPGLNPPQQLQQQPLQASGQLDQSRAAVLHQRPRIARRTPASESQRTKFVYNHELSSSGDESLSSWARESRRELAHGRNMPAQQQKRSSHFYNSESDGETSDASAITLHDMTTSPNERSSLQPLAKIESLKADFVVLSVVSSGVHSKVMQVRRRQDGKVYALKSVQRGRLVEPHKCIGALTGNRVLRRARCPFVARIHFAFQSSSRLYLVTDFVSGVSLFSNLRARDGTTGGNREACARFYAAEIVLALEHLHLHGIVHGNLKPSNVLTDHDGHIVLTGAFWRVSRASLTPFTHALLQTLASHVKLSRHVAILWRCNRSLNITWLRRCCVGRLQCQGRLTGGHLVF